MNVLLIDNKPHTDQLLRRHMEFLRGHLRSLVEAGRRLNDPDVLWVSEQLDVLVNLEMKAQCITIKD